MWRGKTRTLDSMTAERRASERAQAEKEEGLRLLARAIDGDPSADLIIGVVFAFVVVGVAIALFFRTQSDIGLEQCRSLCEAKGMAFVYLPDEMGSAEPYMKLSQTCSCRALKR